MNVNLLLAGVGGQGILLAADLLALAGLAMAWDVKKSEIHGVAQQGGSVSSEVRWGSHLYSPLITPGEADYLLAFERLEALRYLHTLRQGATVLANDYRIPPLSVTSGAFNYPTEAEEIEAYSGLRRYLIPATQLAKELGSIRVNNVVLVGALSTLLQVPEAVWLDAIRARVPGDFLALNERAFAAGRAYLERVREAIGR